MVYLTNTDRHPELTACLPKPWRRLKGSYPLSTHEDPSISVAIASYTQDDDSTPPSTTAILTNEKKDDEFKN